MRSDEIEKKNIQKQIKINQKKERYNWKKKQWDDNSEFWMTQHRFQGEGREKRGKMK